MPEHLTQSDVRWVHAKSTQNINSWWYFVCEATGGMKKCFCTFEKNVWRSIVCSGILISLHPFRQKCVAMKGLGGTNNDFNSSYNRRAIMISLKLCRRNHLKRNVSNSYRVYHHETNFKFSSELWWLFTVADRWHDLHTRISIQNFPNAHSPSPTSRSESFRKSGIPTMAFEISQSERFQLFEKWL
jgi:hypothetical protein